MKDKFDFDAFDRKIADCLDANEVIVLPIGEPFVLTQRVVMKDHNGNA